MHNGEDPFEVIHSRTVFDYTLLTYNLPSPRHGGRMRPCNIRRHLHVHVQPAPQQGFHSLNYKIKRTVFKPITK